MITKVMSLEGETDYVSPFVMKYVKIKSKGHLYSQLANLTEHIKTIVLKIYEYAESHGIIDRYDLCYLDVKVRDLKVGDCTCPLPDFHYDWVREKTHSNKEETHFIYSNCYGTIFKADDTETVADNHLVYMYNRDLHRGNIVESDVNRIMIRLSFVDSQKRMQTNKTI